MRPAGSVHGFITRIQDTLHGKPMQALFYIVILILTASIVSKLEGYRVIKRVLKRIHWFGKLCLRLDIQT